MTKQAQPTSFSFTGGKRYAAAGPALREIFGGRVQRISLDGGFTCPTRDGTLGSDGCLYCDARGARAAHVGPQTALSKQLALGIANAKSRAKVDQFISYFQAFTNTYAPPETLREVYAEGLSDPRVVALAIATRPDCLDDKVLDVLEEFSRRSFLWIEIGLQSTRDATLQSMARGHGVEAFTDAAQRLRARGIRALAHIIVGLPGDGREDILAAPALLNDLGFWGVKIHNLFIDQGSPLAQAYKRGDIPLLERAEYLELLLGFLARLSPEILIHRFLAQAPRARHLAPAWALGKNKFSDALDVALEKQNLYQGALLQK